MNRIQEASRDEMSRSRWIVRNGVQRDNVKSPSNSRLTIVMFRSRYSIFRRLICAALVGCYVVAATGLPLVPAKPAASLSGERFPCEACGCGCPTAEVCWTKCCCHSLPERLAWAKREGVRPPETVLAQAHAAGFNVSDWWGAAESKRKPPAPLVLAKAEPKRAKCCCCQPAASQPQPTKSTTLGFRTLACEGITQLWLSIGIALPTFAEVEMPHPNLERRSLPASNSLQPRLLLGPPTPPPRIA